MREAHSTLGAVACLAGLTACATAGSVGQTQEIAPGIYSISSTGETADEAMRKARDYCHAKGRNSQSCMRETH
jgi:hypothetical protein